MEHPGSHCLGREHGTEEASIASLAPVTVRRVDLGWAGFVFTGLVHASASAGASLIHGFAFTSGS